MDEQFQSPMSEYSAPAPAPELTPTKAHLDPFGDTLKRSWQMFKDRFNLIAQIFGVVVILQIAAGFFTPEQSNPPTPLDPTSSIILGILSLALVICAFFAGLMLTIFVLRRDETWTVSSLLSAAVSKFFGMAWISLLTGLAVLLGLILFVIPGIHLAIALSFATYIYIDKGIGGGDALSKSREYVKGYWYPIFGRFAMLGLVIGLPFIIVSVIFGRDPIVNAVLTGLINLVATPLATIFSVLVYEQLKQIKPTV